MDSLDLNSGSSPKSLTTYVLMTTALATFVLLAIRRLVFVYQMQQIPGLPIGLPIVGNGLTILRYTGDELFKWLTDTIATLKSKGPIARVWIGPFPVFFLFTAQAYEVILSSNKLITKSREYNFIQPWLHKSLLLSTGDKWHSRRKLLNPTFSIQVLEEFIPTFNKISNILVNELKKATKRSSDLNIYPFIGRTTVDMISETQLGVKSNALILNDNDYIDAFEKLVRIIQERQTLPWLQPDFIFKRTKAGKEHAECLKTLHAFVENVIRQRKLIYKKEQELQSENGKVSSEDDSFSNKKPRQAFLDHLIAESDGGKALSHADLFEEVNGIAFAGYDTTTMGINWSLFLIGKHPKVQEQICEELKQVFGDSDRPISMADLNELKYLECCIKEALRMYPPVPLIARELTEDTIIHGYKLPKGTSVALSTYNLHRDPDNFPDPDVYQPERHYPENSRGRHPYAYVPFSAGPRNCIAQKFAILEEKMVIAQILRNFQIETLTKEEDLVLLGDVALRPRDGINLRLTPRM